MNIKGAGTNEQKDLSKHGLDEFNQLLENTIISETVPSVTSADSINLCQMSIYFNNINGFISKRSLFLNSSIAKDYDIVILQETNVSEEHVKFDDFSLVGKLGRHFFTVNNEKFCRGSLIAWDPTKIDMSFPVINSTAGYEIGVAKAAAGVDELTIISCYRSPSMKEKDGNVTDYMTALTDTLNEVSGKVLLVGDLNLCHGRKIFHNYDEKNLLSLIEYCDMSSIVNQDTHFWTDKGVEKCNQLDYAYTNCGLEAEVTDGFDGSDHKAFSIMMKIEAEVIEIPMQVISNFNKIDPDQVQRIVDNQAQKIIDAKISTGEAVLEMSIFISEMIEDLATYRVIPQHRRVRHCSRQISMTIFNENLTNKQKRILIKEQLKKDASRQLIKNTSSGRFGARIMASMNLGAKSKQLLTCKLDANDFLDSIMDDEKRTDHSTHQKLDPIWSELAEPLRGKRLRKAVLKAKSKWNMKVGFSEKFWSYIGLKLMSSSDYGVYSFAMVEPVAKDMSKPELLKSWRLVWKGPTPCEKIYDLMKSHLIISEKLINDAYCPNRSTQKALTKVSCWDVSRSDGLLGCDYMNAFGNACRSCVNNLLGFEFLNPKIHFEVNTSLNSSAKAVSITGTGAGRATGGPGFNIALHHKLMTDEELREIIRLIAPFADDSQVKVLIDKIKILLMIGAFERGSELGLLMHRQGKKGPTLLVHKDKVEEVTELFRDVNEDPEKCDLNVVTAVKFLGGEIHLCAKKEIMVARLASNTIKLLSFYVTELSRSVRLFQFEKDKRLLDKSFESMSQATASLIESRIQYLICFMDMKTLVKVFNIHRRAVTALSGKSFRFFNFKNMMNESENWVDDLYDTIENLQSMTYLKLCMALGRPSLMQMALRGVNVILKQGDTDQLIADYNLGSNLRNRLPPFIAKMYAFRDKCKAAAFTNASPRLNEYYENYMACESFHTRRNFLKALTDNLLIPHLESKGWTANADGCRIEACEAQAETLEHMLTHIPQNNLNSKTKKDFNKALNKEKKRKNCEHPRLGLGAEAALLLAGLFDEVNEPPLKICKKTVVVRGRGRPATRRPSMVISRNSKRKKTTQNSSKRARRQRLNVVLSLACLLLVLLGACVSSFNNIINSENPLPVQKFLHFHCHEKVPEKYFEKIKKTKKMTDPNPNNQPDKNNQNNQNINQSDNDDTMGRVGGINPFQADAEAQLLRRQEQLQQQQQQRQQAPPPRSESTTESTLSEIDHEREREKDEKNEKEKKEVEALLARMAANSEKRIEKMAAYEKKILARNAKTPTDPQSGSSGPLAIQATDQQQGPMPRSESNEKVGELFREKKLLKEKKRKIYEDVKKIDDEKKKIMDMAKAQCEGLDKLRAKRVKEADAEFAPFKSRFYEINEEVAEVFRSRPERMAERGETYVKSRQESRKSSQSPKPKKSRQSQPCSKSGSGKSSKKKSDTSDKKKSSTKKSVSGGEKTSQVKGRNVVSGSKKPLTSNPLGVTEEEPSQKPDASNPPTTSHETRSKKSQTQKSSSRSHKSDNSEPRASGSGHEVSSRGRSVSGRERSPRRRSPRPESAPRGRSDQPRQYMTNHPFYPRPNTGPFDAARFERMRMEEQEERRRRREMWAERERAERERREHRGHGEWYDDWLARYGYPPRSGSKRSSDRKK